MHEINIEPGRPEAGEFLHYFEPYIAKAEGDLILPQLEKQMDRVRSVLNSLSTEQVNTLHEPYTWTIKQVIGHCVDSERVFGYRAGCFAAGDQTSLPGFDQDDFVRQTDYDPVCMTALIEELDSLRQSNLAMFRRQNSETWMRKGMGDGKVMTVRAAAFILVGHVNHHLQIIEKRIAG